MLYSGFIFLTFVFIALQLVSLNGENNINPKYLSVYQPLSIICIIGALAFIILQLVNGPDTADLGFIATRTPFRPLSMSWLKFVIIGIWALGIALAVTTVKIQFLPIPVATTGLQLTDSSNAYLMSVIPGFLEDFAYLIILPQMVIIILTLLFNAILKIDLRRSVPGSLLLSLLGCFIASLGYGIWLIPGFTSSHAIYGENIPAFLSAFIFGFMQSFIYQITGFFLPVAHILHNLIYSLGLVTAISIGGIAASAFLLIRIKNKEGLSIEQRIKNRFHEFSNKRGQFFIPIALSGGVLLALAVVLLVLFSGAGFILWIISISIFKIAGGMLLFFALLILSALAKGGGALLKNRMVISLLLILIIAGICLIAAPYLFSALDKINLSMASP